MEIPPDDLRGSSASEEKEPEEMDGVRDPNAAAEIKALLRRNYIERRRTKSTTFCELCSPVLLLCVLVYGYSLSDVLVFPEKVYSSVRLDLPGGFGGLLPLARLHGEDLANASLPDLGSSRLATGGSSRNDPAGDGYGGGDDTDTGDDDIGSDSAAAGEEDGLSFGDVKHAFNEMTGLLEGPCPIPDLDQFVGLGTAVAGDLGDGVYGQVVNNMESGWVFGNIITQGALHFAPAGDPAVGELVSWLSNTTSGFDALTHHVHESEDAAVEYALDHLDERTWAVIALDEAADGRVDYTIRMNLTVTPNTNHVVDMIAIGLDPSFRSYYLSGFLTLQTTLDRFMFSRALPAAPPLSSASSGLEQSWEISSEEISPGFACVPPDVLGVPFPTAAYDQNLFYAAIGYLLGLAMTMSTMYPLSRLVKGIVEEKESRVRETMRIMGLRVWCHELSWFITGVVIFTFIAVTVSALLSWTFLPLADGGLLLVYMAAFTLSEVGMALLVASVFSKAKLASIAAPCVLFAGVLPRYIFYGSNRHEAPGSKTFASLLSPAAFTFGADFIADYEYAGIGAGWGNWDEGEYSLKTSIGMMFLDSAVYCMLAWYLDKVVTPEFGTSRDPLKALTVLPRGFIRWAVGGLRRNRRWLSLDPGRRWTPVRQSEDEYDNQRKDNGGGSSPVVTVDGGAREGAANGGSSVGVEGGPADFEPLEGGGYAEGEGGRGRGVVIKGLRKEFGSKVAVAGLDLRLRVGDITCLLGHNGAGKSTTISMLTGQLGATSGDAVVWGQSVRDNLHQVRQNIGICPQHDALMPLLTAREHIEMYMDIKGMKPELKGPLVKKKLTEVGLLEKEHTPSMSLSGGQKRKLSVALALTGSPSLCILDEPTSGMDPYSRRFTWDLLRRGRAGRCTLLSTHFMEEADHLGDRVAMLRKGKLRCAGSPLFLKSRFGLGYRLTLVKASDSFEPNSLTSLVLSHVADAETLSAAGGEISFRLPRENSANFPGLFRALEAGRGAMGIGGYGVSITSLEEVFLSLEREGRLTDAAGARSAAVSARTNAHGGGVNGVGETGRGVLSRGQGACEIEMQSMQEPASSSRRGGPPPHAQTASPPRQDEVESAGGKRPPAGGGGGREGARGISSGVVGGDPKAGYGRFSSQLGNDEEDLASLLAEGQEDDLQEEPELGQPTRRRMHGAGGPEYAAVQGGDAGSGTKKGNGGGETAAAVAGLWRQLRWLLWKRRVVAFRDWKGGLYQVVLPAMLVALVLVLLTIDVKLAGPSLAMSAEMFGGPTQVLYAYDGREAPEGDAHADVDEDPGREAYANIAKSTETWTHVDRGEGLAAPTSTGLSRYMLDTYSGGVIAPARPNAGPSDGDPTGVDPETPSSSSVLSDASSSPPGGEGDNQEERPPRYGAFVFGDRIPVNVTVDWDSLRERPEVLESALEVVGDEILPPGGGEFDLQGLLAVTGLDKDQLAKLILEGSDKFDPLDQGGQDMAEALFPGDGGGGSSSSSSSGRDAFEQAVEWATGRNWTHEWLDLVDEDPTVRYAEAAYLPESSELKLEGVVVSVTLKNDHNDTQTTQSIDLGEVRVSVDDLLNAVPPGTVRYDKGVLGVGPNPPLTTVMFNSTAPHALPAWLGELTAKTFEACAAQRGLEEGKVSYTARSHPLPLTATESLEVQTMLSLLVSLLVTIPLCYAPAAFVTFLVRERACKSKRVQLVSGASPLAYWVSAYLWDVALFFVLTVLVMLTFAAYGRDASKVFMMHWDALLGTWGLLISYGLSALPLSYLYSFAFDGPSAAQISIAGINFLSGFGFVIAYAVLSSLEKTVKFAARAQHVFRLFPPYLLGDGLIKVSSEFYMREVLGMDREWGVLAWDVAGKGISYMCLEAAGYLGLVLAVEYSLAAGVRGKADRLRLRLGGWSSRDLGAMLRTSTGVSEDKDVKDERERVDRAYSAAAEGWGRGQGGTAVGNGAGREGRADTVLIRGLTKVYPAPMSSAHKRPKRAVRGLSLGVKRGECFGLLGINGAGKSTTLQILTRDLQATSGDLSVKGKPITSSAVCRLLGYCPQTDPLLPLMSVSETLLFFGGLKGVGSEYPGPMGGGRQDSVLQKAAEEAMSAVSLGNTGNQLAGTLSGGNKRKLSLAVALIGGPPVLLLDEPSSGMDPGARRSMWEVISSLSTSRSVILTTHSMEECEAVCDRLGIMVGGRLRCIGTPQHLKGRFGGGYSVEVRCPADSMPRVTEMIRGLSPLARLDEMHPTLAKFSIPAGGELREQRVSNRGGGGISNDGDGPMSTDGLSLSKAFETIEARKAELQVWDYSISQATLETIFMSFAKNQEEEVTSVPGVQYTDTENNNTTTRDDGPTGRPCTRRSMDVEMGRIGGGLLSSRQCGAGTASRETFAEQGETATFV